MGYGVGHRTYHTSVVRGPVTKDIVRKTPDMLDEASLAFDELIGSPDGKTMPEKTLMNPYLRWARLHTRRPLLRHRHDRGAGQQQGVCGNRIL